MIHTLRSLLLVALVCWLSSWQSQATAPTAQSSAEIALQVTSNGETYTVTRDEYANWLVRWRGEYFTRDFARSVHVKHIAEKAGVDVTDAEVDEALNLEVENRLYSAFRGDRAAWAKELAGIGRSEGGWRAQRRIEIADELRAARLLVRGRVDDPERVQRVFESRYGVGGRRVQVDWIRLDVNLQAPERATPDELTRLAARQRQATLDRANAIVDKARKGADFGELAKAFSDDAATKDRGGRVEDFFEPKLWAKDSIAALDRLAEGAISDPVFANGAWQIVKLRKRVVTKLEDVKTEVMNALETDPATADEISRWLTTIGEGLEFSVDPNLWLEGTQPPEQIVAKVDGAPVTRKEFSDYALELRGESLVPTFLEQWLTELAARKAGVSVSEDELVARIRGDVETRLDEQYSGDKTLWTRTLAAQGRSEEGYWREQRIKTASDILAEKIYQKTRTFDDAALVEAWTSMYGAGGRKIEVRMLSRNVVFPTAGPDTTRAEYDKQVNESREATRKHVLELRERILKGEDFAALAKLESQDVETRSTGGEFAGGWRAERFPSDVATAVRSLRLNELSQPIEFRGMFALFQVTAEKNVPFESVRAEIEKTLRAQRPTMVERASFVNELVTACKFEVLPALYRRSASR